jgi:hypothetical protein
MSGKRRCAVGADDLEVLDAVVGSDTVDVVEDQRHPSPFPGLALPAQLAHTGFDARRIQAFLQLAARVRRVRNEHFLEGPGSGSRRARTSGVRVEVRGRDSPLLDVLLNGLMVSAGRAQPQLTEHVAETEGLRHRRSKVLLGDARPPTWHEHMFA